MSTGWRRWPHDARIEFLRATSGYDVGNCIAVDSSGSIYMLGETFSTDFPVTSSSIQSTAGGAADAFIAKIGVTSPPAAAVTALTNLLPI
jgi:hypothetical protein